jgi:hypothetical protein
MLQKKGAKGIHPAPGWEAAREKIALNEQDIKQGKFFV